LALIKCHARAPVDTRAIRLERSRRNATLHFAEGWVERHPRTLHLLREEANSWQQAGPLGLDIRA
jgi:exopolyphosphatase/guanosine-5'-triphosphate,3'-diphosphate pyrophosphatase